MAPKPTKAERDRKLKARLRARQRVVARMAVRIGKRVRERRMALGWSQMKVANDAGIDHSYVSRIERGMVRRFDIGVIARVEKALGLSHDANAGASTEAAS